MILIIDNYDSFVHNLARYFRLLGCPTQVRRNDEITVAEIRKLAPAAIVLSPGPCSPDEAGICLEATAQLHPEIPILGICLGHQTIIQALGGQIVSAGEPVHGRSSQVTHTGTPLFRDVTVSFEAGRYHSLVGHTTSLPVALQATAHLADQTIMAVEHQTLPIVGLQFHPESILTACGFQLISNFLTRAGIEHWHDRVGALQTAQHAGGGNLPTSGYAISPRLSKRPN